MTDDFLYSVQGIGKAYGHVVALDQVDFGVRAGEVVGLVGDNGAGKSTLVKTLSGALKPDRGEIHFNGERVEWSSPHEALESGIETLYQDSGLAPDLSVSANIFLGRELTARGLLGRLGILSKRRMDTRAAEELARVGVSIPSSSRPVTELSGGQRQAVAIGRAVTWARDVLILDEPTNHLGARQSAEVLAVIKEAKRRGLAVIFISHTLPHVRKVTDRIVVLRLGKVVADAPTSEFDADSLVKTITGLEAGIASTDGKK